MYFLITFDLNEDTNSGKNVSGEEGNTTEGRLKQNKKVYIGQRDIDYS